MPASAALRVFMSVGRNASIAEQVRAMLSIADNECHVSARGGADSLLVAGERSQTMRRCEAAVIVITSEDAAGGEEADGLGLGLTIEICAAEVLYGGRVALVCEEGLRLPRALDSLPRFTFGGGGLTLDVGIDLMKAAKDFQRRAPRRHDGAREGRADAGR